MSEHYTIQEPVQFIAPGESWEDVEGRLPDQVLVYRLRDDEDYEIVLRSWTYGDVELLKAAGDVCNALEDHEDGTLMIYSGGDGEWPDVLEPSALETYHAVKSPSAAELLEEAERDLAATQRADIADRLGHNDEPMDCLQGCEDCPDHPRPKDDAPGYEPTIREEYEARGASDEYEARYHG